MMSAPAGPPRAISGTATSLQAICAAAHVLEFVGGDGLARVDGAAREFVADDGQLLAREREVGFGSTPDGARLFAREYRGGGGAAQTQANRAQHTFRAPLGRAPESSDLVSTDFTGFSAAVVLSVVAPRD